MACNTFTNSLRIQASNHINFKTAQMVFNSKPNSVRWASTAHLFMSAGLFSIILFPLTVTYFLIKRAEVGGWIVMENCTSNSELYIYVARYSAT